MKISPRVLKTFYYVGPLVVWMVVIFCLSTDVASAQRLKPAVGGTLHRLLPFLTLEQIARVDWNIRKCYHVSEYSLLGILLYRAVAFGNPVFRSRNLILPLLLGVLYAATDEFHQSFYPSRGATAADVVFDSFGVTIGLLLCLWQRALRFGPAAAAADAATERTALR